MGEGLKKVRQIIKNQPKRSYKFRAKIPKKNLYFYTCEGCGKKRSSRIYDRALDKHCQICVKNKVAENQPSLFHTPYDEATQKKVDQYDFDQMKEIAKEITDGVNASPDLKI